MSSQPPGNQPPSGQLPPDLAQPGIALHAVGQVALRLMAGAVPKPLLGQLQRMVQQAQDGYPWQEVTRVVLAQPVDEQKVVQQGLVAQRDWILRGGRETPGRPLGHRAKGLLARLVAQFVVLIVYGVLLVGGLLLLQHKFPEWNIYRLPQLVGLGG